jgi:hypothetical protein
LPPPITLKSHIVTNIKSVAKLQSQQCSVAGTIIWTKPGSVVATQQWAIVCTKSGSLVVTVIEALGGAKLGAKFRSQQCPIGWAKLAAKSGSIVDT